MAERALDPRDAAICDELAAADDPFSSGAYPIIRLDQAAAELARRTKVAATFTRGHRGPALVLIEGNDDHD